MPVHPAQGKPPRPAQGEKPSEQQLPMLAARHPVSGKLFETDYSRDVRIGKDTEKEIRELPSKLAWYMALRDVAADDLREAKHAEECTYEDVFVEVAANGGKVTEVKEQTNANPRVRQAVRARMEAESRHKHAESVVAAMEAKRWMIQTLVKLTTAEMQTGLGDA